MKTQLPRRLRAILQLATIAAFAIPAAFGQNSFSESIHKVQTSDSQPATKPTVTPPQRASSPAAAIPTTSPTAPRAASDPRFAKSAIAETRDFGVSAPSQLYNGPMHGQTPTQIPGGSVISTEALNALYQDQAGRFIVFDVLGGGQGLPRAQNALGAAQAGTFNDQNQQQFGQYLQQMTGGNKQIPLVFYCQSVECWMSYNAALRAINLGYTQVFWYRGGIEAWQTAGLQTFGNQQ